MGISKMTIKIGLINVADAKIGVPIHITANIASDIAIKNVEWTCDKQVNFTISLDQKTYNFTPSVDGEYTFTCTVWDTAGLKGSAYSRVNVGSILPPPVTPPPEPQPTGILWSSTSQGKWNNGIPRTYTGHHEYDKYDPLTEVAAGENRKWVIDGAGNTFLSGARARVYNHIPQKNNGKYQWLLTYIPNPSLDNLSLEFWSRHNEDDPPENRYGGNIFSIHKDVIEFDEEQWHNERNGGDSQKTTFTIENGKTYIVKVISQKVVASATDITYKTDIWINSILQWHKEHKTPYPQSAIKESLYWRFRTNGDAPVDVKVWDVSISQV